MNTAVPSGVTLTSVESMEIQTAGTLGVAAVTGSAAVDAVKEIDTLTISAVVNSVDSYTVTYGGVTVTTALTDASATKAESATLIANAINAIAGSTVATVVGEQVVVTAPVAGTALPSYTVVSNTSGAADGVNRVTKADSVANVVASAAVTAVTAVAYDVSGFTDTTDVSVTTSNGMALKAAATQNVTVSGATGTITVDGGKDVTVTDATAAKAITIGATTVNAGKVTVTDTNVGAAAIAVDGGTDVTITATGSSASTITVGNGGAATDLPSGTVNVTSNHKATAGTDVTLSAITAKGGSTITVTQTADTSKAATDKTGATLTQGAVAVTAGTATTAVTVTQAKSTAEVLAVDAVAGVTQSASVKFGALKSGDSIILGTTAANDALGANEIRFTAAKDLTAAEVAQAFASLANPDTQGAGKVANGTYSLSGATSFFNTYTSSAANGDTVVFTSNTANTAGVAALVVDLVNTSTTSVEPVVTATAGVTAVAAKTGVLGVQTGTVAIDDNATAASVTTVTLDGYGNTTIGNTNTLSKLQTLNLSNSGSTGTAGETDASVTLDAATVASLALSLNNIKGNVSLDGAADSALKTLNVTTSGANSTFGLTAASVETLTVAGDKALDIDTGSTLSALKSVTVSGSAGLSLGDLSATLTSVNTSATTGAVTSTIDGAKATYTGGSGVDTVTLATTASLTKAIDLGAGDDTLDFGALTVTATTATLSGGDGTDTLVMNMTAAAALDDTAQSHYTGFERLTLSNAAGNTTLNLANLGFTNYVTTTGSTGTLTLNNLASNGTVVLTTAPTTGYTVGVKDAATGTADVLNVVAQVVSADINFGVITAANVETINLTATDTKLDDDADGTNDAVEKATAVLTADKATTVNLGSSNANIDLTLTGSTAVTLVDGSAMTGSLKLTAAGAAGGTEVRGGSGNDELTASGENDVLKGNGGNDIFHLTDLTSAYGGAGADVFNFAVNTNLTKVSKIYELGSGDVIALKDLGTAAKVIDAAGVAVTKFYAAGAQYNVDTTTDVAGKVNAALVQTGEGEATWFNHNGNTYIVIDADDVSNLAAGAVDTYQAGEDIVIQIIGEFNLGTGASFNTTTGTLEII